MNYFGHAVMAHRYCPEPAFVLGAMLPDLVQLTDEPLGNLADTDLMAGVEFHHRTDALFHASPTFVMLCRESLALARDAGVRKGPARGMTHLVVELVIDAKLAEEAEAREAYMRALAVRPEAIVQRPRLAEGLDWLEGRGPAVHNATPARLAVVLGSALRRRARLEPLPEELEAALGAWRDLPARVDAELASLLADLAPLFDEAAGKNELSPFGESIRDLSGGRPVTSAP